MKAMFPMMLALSMLSCAVDVAVRDDEALVASPNSCIDEQSGDFMPNGTSCGDDCACERGHERVCYVGDKCVMVGANGKAAVGTCAVGGGCK